MSRRGSPVARGFTLAEVLVASALLGIVGAATVGFLGAFAQGTSDRARISDPAIEGALLSRRVAALAPAVRSTLAVGEGAAALWLSDRVPSRTVHASELGWLRHEAESKAIVFEWIPAERFRNDRTLEEEFEADTDFLALRESFAHAELLSSTVVAEGVAGARFERGFVEISNGNARARARIVAGREEEPLR
jgi:prepilin-type N-terminal cleavage/methylation domain-containing protein